MQISILNISVETKPTKTGKSYQQAEVAFKNLTFQGKVEAKKLMSFGAQEPAFKALVNAQSGQVFDIVVVKNAAGYNDWTSATPSDGSAPPAAAPVVYQPGAAKQAAPAPVRSSYETPEERAAKQVYIIRQSNLNSAVSMLGVGAKAPLKLDDVLFTAKAFENYVLDVKPPAPDASGFDDMDSDVPL